MCAHRQAAWHPTAVSIEDLHQDGILVPLDLFLMFPVLHGHQMGLPVWEKKYQELRSTLGKEAPEEKGVSNKRPVWKAREIGIEIWEISTIEGNLIFCTVRGDKTKLMLTKSRPKAWESTISCSSFFLMYSADSTIPWAQTKREQSMNSCISALGEKAANCPRCWTSWVLHSMCQHWGRTLPLLHEARVLAHQSHKVFRSNNSS